MKLDLLNDLYRAEMRHLKDLSDILCDRDLELSGHLREVPWAILRDENENGHLPYTEALVTAAHGRVNHEFAQAPINTYPFGTPTTQVFPEFLGICAGETKLRPALNAVKGYCEKARKNLPQDQSKTVMVFTDKWNGPLFQKYFELAFLRYALENNILFLFFLVSDYGVSRIPFLAKNHADLDELRRRGYNIERENPGVSGLKILQHFSPCTYECRSGTWGRYGSSSYYDLHYHFDFHSISWR